MLLSNPFEYNSQWKITPSYIQDVDETFCDMQRKRIQILRKKKECDPNDSLANDIANYKSKTKTNGYKLHKKIGKHIGEKNKGKLQPMLKYGSLRLAGDDCDAWKTLTTNETRKEQSHTATCTWPYKRGS